MILYIGYLILNIEWVQGHIYKGCDIMERVGVRHRYSGCDATNIVNMLLHTMDMMSSYIWMRSHQYSWCDIINIVDVLTEIAWIQCQI